MENNRVSGKITKLAAEEGWGFVSTKEIPFTRIFFHWSALIQDTLTFPQLKVGMKCEFKAIEIPGKGWRAVQIKIIEKEKEKEVE